jgi:hypothetical protein
MCAASRLHEVLVNRAAGAPVSLIIRGLGGHACLTSPERVTTRVVGGFTSALAAAASLDKPPGETDRHGALGGKEERREA